MARLLKRTLALEDYDGIAHTEKEWTLYGKVKDFEQLAGAHVKEEHEQWKLPLDTDKPIRARLRLIDGRRFTMTTKEHVVGQLGAIEVDSDISRDMFYALLKAGVDGYKKTRYEFHIPGTNRKWEIDVFLDRFGNPHPWVKIDYEFDDPHEKLPELPIDFSEMIVEGGPKQTLAERRFVQSLWESEWSKLDPVDEAPTLKE